MKLVETPIPDLFVLEPKIFEDSRGYFLETYSQKALELHGLTMNFIQDNESKSEYGVIRGLHYQLAPYAQTKLVRVVLGTIIDVAVDLRRNSPTFGKHFTVELNSVKKNMLLVPRGFAHGFSVLSETAVVCYKCDGLYTPEAERGILYNDSQLGIDWKVNSEKALVSAKDKVYPAFSQAEMNFIYGKDKE